MKVVSLINMKGGVAKTTLAVNLADCLAVRHNKKVLLVDVDPQFNATQCLMKPEDYIAHLSNNGDTITNVFDRATRPVASTVTSKTQLQAKKLEDIKVRTVKKNFSLLPGNLELFRLEMAPGDGRENRLKNYLNTVESEYDFVIVDTPPTPSVWMTSALIASDYFVIPVKADPISLTGIDLLNSIIEEKRENFDLKIKCAGLVLTVTEPTTLVFQNAKKYLEESPSWVKLLYNPTLPKRTAIAKLQLDQTHILEGDCADSKFALTQICAEFLKRVS